MVCCQCLKYIYIYICIYIHSLTYTQMARERCGALSVLGRESVREANAQNQQDGNPRKLPAVPTGPQPGHEACECVCVSVRVCVCVCVCNGICVCV